VRGLTISAHGGLDRLELRDDLPVPALVSDTQVRVRILAAALNHLDLFVVGGMPNVRIVPPWILGSDGMGRIEAIGSAVSGLDVGDHVLINPGLSDRTCDYCLAGEQPLCPRFGVLGEHVPGTITERIVLPAANVRRVAGRTNQITGS
jgi:D-arabinose 1-dehydrogenase-like Zn-dependent alcohol dehydrogenase